MKFASFVQLYLIPLMVSLFVKSALALEARDDQDVPGAYLVVEKFFQQDNKDTDADSFDFMAAKFGLDDGVTWNSISEEIEKLNDESDESKYKLFFLARHGEGYHNVIPSEYPEKDWVCHWQTVAGNGKVTWEDALLTPKGERQTDKLATFWKGEINGGAPLPQSFYVSPLRRTLQTFNRTWNEIIDIYTTRPLIKEFAREQYGIATESKRHPASYIKEKYPFGDFESGFSEDDDLWVPDKEESKEHMDYRAQVLLNDIFVNDPNTVISITTHSGTIKSILKVINHRKWPMTTGEVIPVVIKASNFGPFEKPELNKPWKTLEEECKDA